MAIDLKDFADLPKVFFAYSYRDSEKLKPLFRKACIETGFSPLFADEIKVGETIFQKLHQMIISCDIVVVAITEYFSPWISIEIGFSEATKKPVLFFAQKPMFLPMDFYGYHYVPYEKTDEFLRLLVASLLRLKPKLKRKEYIEQKKEEKTLADILSNSLEKNVLILGKDSDDEGLTKMKRIAKVLSDNDYSPVTLKELPEITYLSFEDKMIRIGALSRFVIVEDTRASGHIDEVRLCAECQYITATVREAGTSSTWMQAHYPAQYSFINRFCYSETAKSIVKDELCDKIYCSLEKATEEAITWAEKRIGHQKKYFNHYLRPS
jgi:nucleoside 2-deoxyribosyltransferase